MPVNLSQWRIDPKIMRTNEYFVPEIFCEFFSGKSSVKLVFWYV